MKIKKKGFALWVVLLVLSLTFTSAGATPEPLARGSEPVSVDATPPTPVYPAFTTIVDTTPEFQFTRLEGAGKYQIEVTNSITHMTVYTFTGPANCDASYCYLQPATVLGIHKFNGTNGEYGWRVRGKVSGYWQNWSAVSFFGVLSPGFSQNFQTDKAGWKPLTGTWEWEPGKMKGTTDSSLLWSSTYNKVYTWDFTYQVKMKRIGDKEYAHGIAFWGNPVASSDGQWNTGVFFEYGISGGAGYYRIYKMVDGISTSLVGWTTTTAVDPNNWNTLTVVVRFPGQHYFINGVYLGYTEVETPSSGYLGIQFAKGEETSTLLVDRATMEAINNYTEQALDPAMKLDTNPVQMEVLPSLP